MVGSAGKLGGEKKHKIGLLQALLVGSVAAACVLFFPVHVATEDSSAIGSWQVLLLSILDSMEVNKYDQYGDLMQTEIHCYEDGEWVITVYDANGNIIE